MYESKKKYHYGTGRRKSSVARVRVYENGTGSIIVNGRDIDEYFGLDTLKLIVRQPLVGREAVIVLARRCDTAEDARRHDIRGRSKSRTAAARVLKNEVTTVAAVLILGVAARRERHQECQYIIGVTLHTLSR